MAAPSPPIPPSKSAALAHLEQARLNYKLYRELKLQGEHLDWAVTLMFYTALHLIQAYLVEIAATGFDIPSDHEHRDRCITLRLAPIAADYSFLQTRSNWARYQPTRPRPSLDQVEQYETVQFARIVAELRRRGVTLEE
jgi:hypothetical protein